MLIIKSKYKISERNHASEAQRVSTANLNILIFCFLFLFFPKTVFAENNLTLSAIPPRLEINVKPGEVVTKEIKIRNESNISRSISTSIKDFIVTNDSGTPTQLEDLDPDQNRWAASSWIQISPSQITLKPGETKVLTLTILAPDNAIPGGHYAMVLHSPKNETFVNENGSTIETNVGTLVYITIPGNVKEDAKIKDFSVPQFSETGPINFKTTVNNLSDVHILPVGAINITNIFGFKTAQLKLDKTNIFPYTDRHFENTLNKKFLCGRYKAQFLAAFGTTGQTIMATVFFWVIPWKLLVLIFIATFIFVLLVKILKNKKTFQKEEIEKLEKELEDLKNQYKDKK